MSGRTFLRGLVAALARDTPAFGGPQQSRLRYTKLRHHALAVAERYGCSSAGGFFFLATPSGSGSPAEPKLREALIELSAYGFATSMPYRISGMIAFKRTNAGTELLAEWDAAHPDGKDGE